MNYQELKSLFQASRTAFAKLAQSNDRAQKTVIKVLAESENDNGWPLAMLHAIKPDLAEALRQWSAGMYEDVRLAQERSLSNEVADVMEAELHNLPRYRDCVTHVSKDSAWFERFQGGRLELRSFLSTSGIGGSFAYAAKPAVTLRIERPRRARLIGALTTENFEREVLFPKGTCLRLVRMDRVRKVIDLVEDP